MYSPRAVTSKSRLTLPKASVCLLVWPQLYTAKGIACLEFARSFRLGELWSTALLGRDKLGFPNSVGAQACRTLASFSNGISDLNSPIAWLQPAEVSRMAKTSLA